MAGEMRHLSVCFFAIHKSSLVKCLKSFAHYKKMNCFLTVEFCECFLIPSAYKLSAM